MNQVTKNVVLEKKDLNIIQVTAENRGLGVRGFSAALRMIVREWAELTRFSITEKGKQALVETQIDPPEPTL